MATFEELVAYQQSLATEIETLIRNVKKDSSSRKTHKYYEERLQRLEDSWSKFESIDNKIRCLSDLPLTHQYFTHLYLHISNKTLEHRNIFESEMLKLLKATDIHRKEDHDGALKENPAGKVNEQEPHDATINKLIRNQKALMRALSRNIDEFKETFEKEHPEPYYQAKASLITKYMNEMSTNNELLWQSTTSEDIDGYTQDAYYELEAQAHNTLSNLQQRTASINPNMTPTTNANEQHLVRLPKIQIPRFNGSYLHWVVFKDLYMQLIHNAPMSEVQKMFYLTTHLSDEPKNLIKHLPISTANYETAWNLLINRYDNKRLIVTSLLNNLLSHPKIKNETSQALKCLHDLAKECIHGLKAQGIPVEQWDAIIVHILLMKLGPSTETLFEQSLNDNKRLINVTELLTFIEHRFQALETRGKAIETGPGRDRAKTSTIASTTGCKVCGSGEHAMYYCAKFLKMAPAERLQWTQKKRLCVNCFKPDHRSRECTSRSCSKCTKKHNTLLHLELARDKPPASATEPQINQKIQKHDPSPIKSNKNSNSPIVASANQQMSDNHYILLATARVQLTGSNGRVGVFRALLDSGSQVNLITEKVLNKLTLNASPSSLCIEGIGRKIRNVSRRINLELTSMTGGYSTRIEAFVLPNIVSPQPTTSFETSGWDIPDGIQLADPYFNATAKIDLLIGAEFYHQLMCAQQIKLSNELPTLQRTRLGWIVTGRLQEYNSNSATCAVLTSEDQTTNELIEKFWKLDDTNDTSTRCMSLADKRCESHFTHNVKRNKEGRFIVRLPFSENPSVLGNSRSMAFNRFLALERRLENNSHLRQQYNKFMLEYESLGHMEEILEKNIPDCHYVLPHHCVLKPESSTTKLRVVFDASAKTSSGSSLNDILHAGPTVQSELFSILLRFRMHKYVFTADIEKMYRQILVDDADQPFQLILWRFHKDQDIKCYRLKTVTYGTSSAPYLATKCLQYLANQNTIKYPLGAAVLHDDFYVDDCISGADTLNNAIESQQQVDSILKGAGFKLRKWCSNHPQLLSGIPPEDQEINLNLEESATCIIKTLGLIWLPRSDQLCGRAQRVSSPAKGITKRVVSSELAKIHDPLGLFGPVVVKAKIFLQELWQLPLTWDDELPAHLQRQWNDFRSSIEAVNEIKVDRFVFNHKRTTSIEIHTFVDASERAYGAAIYIRSTYTDSTITTRLICSKSRVAPIKKQTLPRLELCAAVLGAELTSKVKQDLRLQNNENFFWTDSQIVLAWINSPSGSFHTFVANRIAKIQCLSLPEQWHHVNTKENPADAISRGIPPETLAHHSIWFYGPLFLSGKRDWPKPWSRTPNSTGDEERKMTKRVLTVSSRKSNWIEIIGQINHRNSFKSLQRIIGYILRFPENTKIAKQLRPTNKALNAIEMENALIVIMRMIQATEFEEELEKLSNNTAVNKASPLASLNPFLDEHQIMRVGGRLQQSTLPFKTKHPAILPHNHDIVKLLVTMILEENRHCGPQALLAATRTNFWITNGKSVARSIVHKCIRCTRARPILFKQLMGNLPASRVTPARPFITAGVDYFGPIWIHHKIRGKRPDKAYVAVFCCFVTKAIHMEVVSNLSTEAFIGALRRFISRRGHCQTLYSDNATNFVGASNKLAELKESIYSQSAQEKIIRVCSDKSINFKFIPPRAPHFGGLWEAAVKSAKHHLVRSVSAASLTYEELETVIVEIEAILNSRPLVPPSPSYDDFNALTPGHFLVGEALTSAVDVNAKPTKMSLGGRWKLTSEIKHNFWKEWTQNYLQELQQRGKWKSASPNVNEGMLVILKEDNIPVLQWPLGRITRIYKGDDGLVRVCDVKTARATFKRPIHRLAPLLNDTQLECAEYDESNPAPAPKRQHSSKEDNSTSQRKRKIVSYSSQGLFSTVFISLLLLPLILASPIKIMEFPSNPGLYFEGIGSTKLVTDTWRFIIYYDLAPLWERNKVLEDGIASLARSCNRSVASESCDSMSQQLRHTWDNLIQESDLLSMKRRRRGAINVIGNVAHALFGVLDSDYAEHMSQIIADVKENENFVQVLVKNQTSVIDSTINVLRESEINTKTRLSQLTQRIYSDLNSIEDENSKLRQGQHIMSLAIQLNKLASDLQRIETDLVAALTHTNHGNLSPLILTPRQLRSEITRIKGHLPTGRTLPVDDDDLVELYKVMELKGAVTNGKIIFIADIPLVNHERFELYKVIPIPTQAENTTIVIQTNIEYLAVNDHRDEYVVLNSPHFNKCITIMNDLYLCPSLQVWFARESDSYSCEVALFNNRTSPNCNFSQVQGNISIIAMNTNNRWVYSTTKPMEMTAVCGNDIINVHINASGILAIEPSCIIKGRYLTIHGHETSVTSLHTSYASFGNLTTIGNPNNVKQLLQPNIDFESQLEQITSIQKRLQDIKYLPTKEGHSSLHQSYITIAALLVSLCITICLLIERIKNKCNKFDISPSPPQPMPRIHISEV